MAHRTRFIPEGEILDIRMMKKLRPMLVLKPSTWDLRIEET
jgi:hypothetical protein